MRILELSSRNKWVIITFDKDFGELNINRNLANLWDNSYASNSKIARIYIAATKMAIITNKYLI
jgi:predicted nuclease of predicted toxin-antitoxin system